MSWQSKINGATLLLTGSKIFKLSLCHDDESCEELLCGNVRSGFVSVLGPHTRVPETWIFCTFI